MRSPSSKRRNSKHPQLGDVGSKARVSIYVPSYYPLIGHPAAASIRPSHACVFCFFFSGRFQPLITRYGSPTATPSTASTAKKLPTSP